MSRQTRVAYAFLAPGLLLFAVYRLYPLLEGLRLSFTNARLGRATMADATVLETRFLDMLRAKGYSKPPRFTPTEFVRSLRSPEIAAVAEQFVTAYQELRFGGKADAAPRLVLLLEELKRQG